MDYGNINKPVSEPQNQRQLEAAQSFAFQETLRRDLMLEDTRPSWIKEALRHAETHIEIPHSCTGELIWKNTNTTDPLCKEYNKVAIRGPAYVVVLVD